MYLLRTWVTDTVLIYETLVLILINCSNVFLQTPVFESLRFDQLSQQQMKVQYYQKKKSHIRIISYVYIDVLELPHQFIVC